MDQRRQFFWDKGYPIRNLTRLILLYYGAYADIPGGAAGEDPVGPAVEGLTCPEQFAGCIFKTIAQMRSFQTTPRISWRIESRYDA